VCVEVVAHVMGLNPDEDLYLVLAFLIS